jgi:DNA-binding XRE family transcriptional regulator
MGEMSDPVLGDNPTYTVSSPIFQHPKQAFSSNFIRRLPPGLESSLQSHAIPTPRTITSRDGRGAVSQENTLRVLEVPEIIVCSNCHMRQLERERGNGRCCRCHHSLGFSYIEFVVPALAGCPDTQSLVATRVELGRLMRRLRFRRGLTQAALADSLSGIHRTYLSRAERGRVMPSIISLMRITRALGVDKVLLRVRSLSNVR